MSSRRTKDDDGSCLFFLSVLRLGQLTCSAIVLGLLAHYVHVDANPSSVIVFGLATASLGVFCALLMLVLPRALILGAIVDTIMAIVWTVVFSLFYAKSWHCMSNWYFDNWNSVGLSCTMWQTVEAFSFMASVANCIVPFAFIMGID